MIGNNIKKPSGTKSVVITENKTTNVDVSKYNNVRVVADVRPKTYGAVWAGTSNPSWSRTDDAVNFADPNPYYAGMSGSPSSPFDGIMPWAGIRRVTDSVAGELVEIPKFYYKWTRGTSDNSMQLQISMTKQAGFLTSPAHADRGDNVGERDYVYIGRYHCSSNDYSSSGASSKINTTRAGFRSGIHNLGSNIWQQDYAMFWTVRMLYLVEFANWNSQAKIGYGCSGGTSGTIDSIPYHTGTTASSRTTYGVMQYRYIVGLWGSRMEWCDGIYFSGANIYCIKNPASFSDSSGGTQVGTRITTSTSNTVISQWNKPTASGFEYALYPSALTGTDKSTYCCDGGSSTYYSNYTGIYIGGNYYQVQDYGMFCMYDSGTNDKGDHITGRLMVLPSQRLTSVT